MDKDSTVIDRHSLKIPDITPYPPIHKILIEPNWLDMASLDHHGYADCHAAFSRLDHGCHDVELSDDNHLMPRILHTIARTDGWMDG